MNDEAEIALSGHVLLDVFVRPKERVTDYRTWVSGVTEHDLRAGGPAISFEDVQKRVAELLKGRILVGHAVHNDLQVCACFSVLEDRIRGRRG